MWPRNTSRGIHSSFSLPFLHGNFLSSGRPFDKTLIHTVESVVIEWSHQVRDVLKRTSAQPLLDGKHPFPLVETEFWKARCVDLESIVDQLYADKAQKMSLLLKRTQSSYYPALQAMVNDVLSALEESRDVYTYLKPLQKHFEDMEETDFPELFDKLPPMFHCVCLVWANSKHYQQPARIVVLLQEVSNLMIELVSFHLVWAKGGKTLCSVLYS